MTVRMGVGLEEAAAILHKHSITKQTISFPCLCHGADEDLIKIASTPSLG